MHPNGASNEAWATALWPDRLMAPSSLHSTASVARTVPRSGERRSRIICPARMVDWSWSNTVGTDWDRFVGHADSATTQPGGGPHLSWYGGGRWMGFALRTGRFWRGSVRPSKLRWSISAVAWPGSCLAVGDARGAEWAARRGLAGQPVRRTAVPDVDAGGRRRGQSGGSGSRRCPSSSGLWPTTSSRSIRFIRARWSSIAP